MNPEPAGLSRAAVVGCLWVAIASILYLVQFRAIAKAVVTTFTDF